jgi:manganese oxidase
MPQDAMNKPGWSRRKILKAGLGGAIATGAIAGWQWQQQKAAAVRVPPLPANTPTFGNGANPMQMLRQFDYGTVKKENGRTVREFEITATNETILQLNAAFPAFNTWSYNGRIPGPVLRATEGDRIRVLFLNQGGHAHTMHFHGIHPSAMDGIRPIANTKAFIYEFDAVPYGVHLYHCHIAPVTRHIGKGLHGMLIIDPKQRRRPADEMVLIMDAFDPNDDKRNDLYAFNGLPDYYMHNPIPIYQNQLVRLYVLNVVEFEAALTFHLHANFFRVYPTGMTTQPTHESDVITMGMAERHILEFSYPYPGKYMFHPHQDEIAEAGCMGMFDVLPS